MDTKNFEAFSRIAHHLLIKLFESFPGYIDVDSNDLGKEAKPIDEDEQYKNIWESKEFANDTFQALFTSSSVEHWLKKQNKGQPVNPTDR